MNFTDIIYFISALFMVSILFLGIDGNFAIIVGFATVAVWFQVKKLIN